MSRRTLAITALTLALIGSLYLVNSPSSSGFNMSASGSQGVPGLEFKLSQKSKNPPSVLVTLKNNNPSSTFTILKWNTPLDSHAGNLGVFKFKDAETGEELKTDVLMLRRKMPIEQDQLQEIAPGAEYSTEVTFSQPWMPREPAKFKVRAEGTYAAAWDKVIGEVEKSELDAYTASPYNDRTFSSEETLLVVE
ncbi:hypothetical protein K504DRAFT_466523 [Pleomassaria siparia CBS 279.74]|uniref:Ubiquitin 3 binding protein But2 C-terminal domain-containing protein n=1 Tax=Pleomassaria siparia CBS 279.74 TaxID=1314801 RepID=A0A6G1KB44_9PLEO|nr:hypothetical protein K504DRAFT_466523 [Pleomassaria siparia CBS 279.74]